MNINQKSILVLFVLSVGVIKAQHIEYSGDPDASFITARDIAFAGNRSVARDTLLLILTKYPDYADVRNLLAKTYSWDGKYEEARKQFNIITSKGPSNKEVWIAAIKNEVYAENYATALGLANKALQYVVDNTEILILKEQATNAIIALQVVAKNSVKEEAVIEEIKIPKNIVAINTSADVFDIVFDPMFYASLSYSRATKYGNIIPKISYSNRFNTNGTQLEVDAYPKFSKGIYAYLNYGYSESSIYPNHRAGAEVYANLPKAMEASLGVRYLDFITNNVIIYTGSYGMYKGNYYFSLRPYVTPSDNNTFNVSGNILARKYLKDKDNYLGLNLSYGYASDLKQFKNGDVVLAETLLYLESQQVSLEYQFTIKNNPNSYKATIGITRQELSFDPGNFFLAVSVGINYQFKF
mgnify:FL=1|tara:strand:- start:27237 stop:28469 length:1233 start_codon:yes stop_codon:yes gene_type:complete